MTPQELRNSILQEAIRGRLVKQRPEEEIEVLVSEEQKRIKKEILDEDDIEIPHTWNAAPLSEVVQSISSKPHQILESQVQKEGIYPVISQSKEYIIGYTSEKDKVLHLSNPVVIFGDHTTEVKIVDFDFVVGADGVKIFSPKPYLLPKFFYYVLQFLCTNIKDSGEYTRHYRYIKDRIVPLPPLAEQKRIVSKIEELMSLCDRYEKAYNHLHTLTSRFPSDIQRSILQEAMQGRLVEQRPEEGTAEELYCQIQEEKERLVKEGKIKKEKPLPEVTPEEEPFEIPEMWKWVRLSSVGITKTGNTPSKLHTDYFGSFIPFIGPGDIQNNVIRYDHQGLSESGANFGRTVEAGTVLQVCIGGSIGKCAISKMRVSFNQQINAITPLVISEKYLFYILNSQYFLTSIRMHSGGTATPIINRGAWGAIPIPLPPLEEQKRIVDKLDELLALCRQLEGRP